VSKKWPCLVTLFFFWSAIWFNLWCQVLLIPCDRNLIYLSTIKFVVCSVAKKDNSYIMSSSTCQRLAIQIPAEGVYCFWADWFHLPFIWGTIGSCNFIANSIIKGVPSAESSRSVRTALYTWNLFVLWIPYVFHQLGSASWFSMVAAWQVLNCNDLFWSVYCGVLNSAYDSSDLFITKFRLDIDSKITYMDEIVSFSNSDASCYSTDTTKRQINWIGICYSLNSVEISFSTI